MSHLVRMDHRPLQGCRAEAGAAALDPAQGGGSAHHPGPRDVDSCGQPLKPDPLVHSFRLFGTLCGSSVLGGLLEDDSGVPSGWRPCLGFGTSGQAVTQRCRRGLRLHLLLFLWRSFLCPGPWPLTFLRLLRLLRLPCGLEVLGVQFLEGTPSLLLGRFVILFHFIPGIVVPGRERNSGQQRRTEALVLR